jgi:hypothetical protein
MTGRLRSGEARRTSSHGETRRPRRQSKVTGHSALVARHPALIGSHGETGRNTAAMTRRLTPKPGLGTRHSTPTRPPECQDRFCHSWIHAKGQAVAALPPGKKEQCGEPNETSSRIKGGRDDHGPHGGDHRLAGKMKGVRHQPVTSAVFGPAFSPVSRLREGGSTKICSNRFARSQASAGSS